MSTPTLTSPGRPPAPAGATPGDAGGAHAPGTWSLTWHGVRTVAVLELRQRIRSTRWKIALVVWFVVVGAITLLASGAASYLLGWSDGEEPRGPVVFSIVVFFVLFLGLLIAPTLSATAINGDRGAGTLATLQVTLLSPAEIVLGKLAAAWIAALAFLVASVPFIVWALALGGVHILSMVTTLLLLAFLLAVMCAIGLGFSALAPKTAGSAVLSYLTVAGLSVGTLMLFGLTMPLITTTDQVTVREPINYSYEDSTGEIDTQPECVEETREWDQEHTERTWWLLAINPFVIVADAAPAATSGDEYSAASVDPLSSIRYAVRSARTGPSDYIDYCTDAGNGHGYSGPALDDSPVWPWGLAANLLLGVGGVVTAVRRLRIPADQLAKGTRVA